MDSPPYTAYAAVYDALGQGRWGAAFGRFVAEGVAPLHGLGPGAALDLACGSGAVALALAGAGWGVVGLDRSAAMLAAARRRAAAGGLPLRLVRADLRAFAFARPFALITCAYDSLNYLTDPADLAAAFARARAALAPGGLFVCDLTTRHAYTGETDGQPHHLDFGDLAVRWLTIWDEPRGLATTTIGVRAPARGRGAWRTEQHIQRPYAPDAVARALAAAGLRPVATYGASAVPLLTPPDPAAPRAIYVAAPAPEDR